VPLDIDSEKGLALVSGRMKNKFSLFLLGPNLNLSDKDSGTKAVGTADRLSCSRTVEMGEEDGTDDG